MTTEVSPKMKVRLWVREQLKDKEEIVKSEIIKQAVRDFAKDKHFLSEITKDAIASLVKWAIEYELHSSHNPMHQTGSGDLLISKEGIAARAAKHDIFRVWLEHVGDRHILLMRMNREDLVVAAAERQQRGDHEIGVATLWRAIADKLEGGQRVEERFTPEEIDQLRRDISDAD